MIKEYKIGKCEMFYKDENGEEQSIDIKPITIETSNNYNEAFDNVVNNPKKYLFKNDKETLNVVIELLNQEIEWSELEENQILSKVSKEESKWFIKGLRSALSIIQILKEE